MAAKKQKPVCMQCLAAIYNGMDQCNQCFIRSTSKRIKAPVPEQKSKFGKWKTEKYGQRD
jgi:hypothetical protein